MVYFILQKTTVVTERGMDESSQGQKQDAIEKAKGRTVVIWMEAAEGSEHGEVPSGDARPLATILV